ncbi:MAG: acetate kinase [Candidatus Nanopelagicales bacterium]|jgi:acetate kinase
MSRVLVVNSGSSSLKYQLVDPSTGEWIAKGLVERIGESTSSARYQRAGQEPVERELVLADHAAALAAVLERLAGDGGLLDGLVAVGHRIVHGGPSFRAPVIVDDAVDAAIEQVVPLAPLHNPAALVGIRVMRRLLPDVPQVAVFDTAFHATIPAPAYTYAIPAALASRHRIRRYGFHGTSYQYVTRQAAALLQVPTNEVNLIVCHLGNGASVAAVRGGMSVDTSMGLTPLQGLVMGTRSGDLDPAVVPYLVREAGMSLDDVDRMLNSESGLKGLSGEQDMRAVRALADAGDAAARLALEVYAYRIRTYIGAYLAHLPGLHALVFTAGIGENDAALRRDVCLPLAHLGFRLDQGRNLVPSGQARAIDDSSGRPRILVVPTNEEAEIAREAARAVATSG